MVESITAAKPKVSTGSCHPRIIAIANQKGGVGKTTTAINLGAALAERQRKVLVVDLDPQGNASTGLGISAADRPVSTYDVLTGEVGIQTAIRPTGISGLFLVPATTDLASIDIELSNSSTRGTRLRDVLRADALRDLGFDYALLDCPPSLNLLTVNSVVAADSVLLPLQSEFFALEGLSQLLLTIRKIRESANPDLRIEGVVLTMHDARNKLAQQVEADARSNLGALVFQTVVPRNVRVGEAPSFGLPVLQYDGQSRGAVAYRALADEIESRQEIRKRRAQG